MSIFLLLVVGIFVAFGLALAAGGFYAFRHAASSAARTVALAVGVGGLTLALIPVAIGSLVIATSTSMSGEGDSVSVEGSVVETTGGMLVPRAQSVGALVARSSVIFLGTVNEMIREHWIDGYSEDGTLVQVSDGGIAVTDYSVSVDSLLVGDSPPTNPIILRMPGHVSNKTGAITSISVVLPTPGDQFLFALGRNPDGTYGSGSEGLLSLDADPVTYIDGIVFADGMTLESLLAELRA